MEEARHSRPGYDFANLHLPLRFGRVLQLRLGPDVGEAHKLEVKLIPKQRARLW